ncbi:sensor histidine kinase [Paractinoplanes bogorensis]|uniref:sensor histidine kinase n=1 Tax=Paractinoplanes bogorensis TaxID=1610840 RepID=UPI001FE5E9B9|nr:HAMP domain-containing sensor histidine kinase [Actinoplanes bogorensis]
MGRLSRLTAGCAGVAVAVFGTTALLLSLKGAPPDGFLADPAAALVPAGLALLLQATPVVSRNAGRVVHGLAALLTIAAVAICVATFARHTAASVATLLALAVLLLLGHLIRTLMSADRRQRELAGFTDTLAQSMNEAVVARDTNIADRKRAEEALSEHAAELERGNTRLRETNTRLENALTFKNDLTSMLTHDVAQPISSIASLAELLHQDWDDLPDDVRHELATKIDKNTQRLIKMMNDLQLLFRLDMGSVTARRVPVPLHEVAETVVAGSAAGPGEMLIEIDAETSVLADRGHVAAVLQNLINNALAYGVAPTRVTARRHGEQVDLVVQDSGPGIPDELLPNLFGRFMRGAGLGLFIVRHLVEANGGEVRYERADPHGARLIATFESGPV